MRFCALSFLILLLPFSSFSQQPAKATDFKDKKREIDKNNAYLELGGSAYFYSLNYERLLIASKYFAFFGRGGMEYLFIRGTDKIIHFPLSINMLIGKKHSFLEMGAGALFRLDFSGEAMGEGYFISNPPTRIFFTPCIGYRFMSGKNDNDETFMFRITISPLFGMNVFSNTPSFIPWGGVSIGKTW